MGRYRSPTRAASCYITPAGKRRLQDEFNYLWRDKRPQVTQAVAEAAAQGDRSENAEYIYGKKQLREIDRRIRFLAKRLEKLQVVDRLPADQDAIFFGAWVTLENDRGERIEYRIVGPDEFDMARPYISIDAPFAKKLLKKRVGDELRMTTAAGEACYTIITIRYEL